jgi:hypothetical protein
LRGTLGNNLRIDHVPIIKRLIGACGERELELLKAAEEGKRVKFAMGRKKVIAKRYEDMLDMAGDV